MYKKGIIDQDLEKYEVHNGYMCDACGAYPIIGNRYASDDKKDYCEECYEKEMVKNPNLSLAVRKLSMHQIDSFKVIKPINILKFVQKPQSLYPAYLNEDVSISFKIKNTYSEPWGPPVYFKLKSNPYMLEIKYITPIR